MIAARQQVEYLSDVDKALLRAILYFDIFDYPITAEEARAFAPLVVGNSFEQTLDKLVMEGRLFKHGEFYSTQNISRLAVKRTDGNRLAKSRMNTAQRYSKLVASFPFVQAVLLSGSISKGFMDEDSDIDYFIITEPKRVWIVRATLALFRRIFLLNSHRNLCTNYFVDVDNLPIPDQNIFAATELCTLKPMYGHAVIRQLREANKWALDFLPQQKFENVLTADREFPVKRVIERVFSFRAMNKINRWLMRKSVGYWQRKYSSQVRPSDFEVAFRSKEGVSKGHPRFFQKRALETLSQKIRKFENEHGLDLNL
jgi:hypothetical protein